jgi:hypothetical protein
MTIIVWLGWCKDHWDHAVLLLLTQGSRDLPGSGSYKQGLALSHQDKLGAPDPSIQL